MKLVLIFPLQKNLFMNKTTSHIVAEESGKYPPLGLLTLATSILSEGKHEVKILDATVEDFDYSDIKNYIYKEKPDVVGITLTTMYLRDGILVAKSVKEVNPEIKVIVGGPHVNIYPIETIKFKEIDYVVMGDGEYVINEVLDRISNNNSLDDLDGVITKTNYRNITPKRLIVDNLDGYPILRRDILNYKKYKSVLAKGSPITTMLTSRGCPFSCPYCAAGNIKLRFTPVKKVVDEIESCVELGIRDILFFDELFTLNKKRVIEICDEIINRSLKIRWHARARIDCVDREMLKKIREAGCRLLQFGIETGTARMQKMLTRNFDLKRITEVIKIAKDEGILTYGNFMFNLPTETEEEMKQTIDFAIKLNLDYAVFGILSYEPGTEWYNKLIQNGILKEDVWKKFAENPLSYNIENTFWPGEHVPDLLMSMVNKAYTRFYIRPAYIFKALFRDETIYQKYLNIKSGLSVLLKKI